MTAFHQLQANWPLKFRDALEEAEREAESHRKEEFNAALRIQSWWRGVLQRKRLGAFHKAATIVQKWYRGWKGRQAHLIKLEDVLQRTRLSYYDNCARKIQAAWRGYYIRKYQLDFYKRKAYFSALRERNELIRNELNNYEIQHNISLEEQRKRRQEEKRLKLLEKQHYMLSTSTRRGIMAKHEDEEVHARKLRKHEISRTMRSRSKAPPELMGTLPRPGQDIMSSTAPPRQQGPFSRPSQVASRRLQTANPSFRCGEGYGEVTPITKIERTLEKPSKEFKGFINTNRRNVSDESKLVALEPFLDPVKRKHGVTTFRPESDMDRSMKAFSTTVRGTVKFDNIPY